MDFYRAKRYDSKYIKYEESFKHTTCLLAGNEEKICGVLEYDIKNAEEAEITNFRLFQAPKGNEIFKGLLDEIKYWNPYLKKIFYDELNNFIKEKYLIGYGFVRESKWVFEVKDALDVFKINIEDIKVEQLTVEEDKFLMASSWIKEPKDIVICCIRIDDRVVCIDGYSRLMVAYKKGFKYVYAFLDKDGDMEFFRNCINWCEEENIFSIKDLENRIVSSAEHEKLWISRCQDYLKNQK